MAQCGRARRRDAVVPGGLRLHPEKTRLVRFHRPPRRRDHKRPPPDRAPGTFDLLGFTHYWGLSRQENWVVKRKTAPSRLTRALRTIARWCRISRHRPIAEQHQTLCQKLRGHFACRKLRGHFACRKSRGHFAYYGITGNAPALGRFRREVVRTWHKWLSRRRRDGTIPWPCFNRLLERYLLPRAVVIHSVYRRTANP